MQQKFPDFLSKKSFEFTLKAKQCVKCTIDWKNWKIKRKARLMEY